MWDWQGPGWMFVMMSIGMLAFWAVVAWVVFTVVRSDVVRGSSGSSTDAERVLDTRYARGEIDEDEYHRRSEVLRATRSASR